MGEDAEKSVTREERLAAKLRENLRRRKAQGRAVSDGDGGHDESGLSKNPGDR